MAFKDFFMQNPKIGTGLMTALGGQGAGQRAYGAYQKNIGAQGDEEINAIEQLVNRIREELGRQGTESSVMRASPNPGMGMGGGMPQQPPAGYNPQQGGVFSNMMMRGRR